MMTFNVKIIFWCFCVEKNILNLMLYEKVSSKIEACVLIVGIKSFDW